MVYTIKKIQLINNRGKFDEYYLIIFQSIIKESGMQYAKKKHLENDDFTTRYELYEHPGANCNQTAKRISFL